MDKKYLGLIQEWSSDKTPQFDYEEAWKTLIKNKSIVNQNIYKTNHIQHNDQDINDFFEGVSFDIDNEKVKELLDLINLYSYYIIMNKELEKVYEAEKKHIKTLNKMVEILEDKEFFEFIDRYLKLETPIQTVVPTKIKKNHQGFIGVDDMEWEDEPEGIKNAQGAVTYYLKNDLHFALDQLKGFVKKRDKKRSDALSVEAKDRTNMNTIFKPISIMYLKPFSKRFILKGLHFELLLNVKLTKKESLTIIFYFFDEALSERKTELSFSSEVIELIKKEGMDIYKYSKVELDKDTPKHIKELNEIMNMKSELNRTFAHCIHWFDSSYLGNKRLFY